jgi:hypothetical protein
MTREKYLEKKAEVASICFSFFWVIGLKMGIIEVFSSVHRI